MMTLAERISALQNEVVGYCNWALDQLRQLLPKENSDLDYHTGPVNGVAIAIAPAFPDIAGKLYLEATAMTEQFEKETNSVRHTGAYWANWASLMAYMGRYDEAVHGFLVAAEEDKTNMNIPIEESFGVKVVLAQWSREHLERVWRKIQEFDSGLTFDDFLALLRKVPECDAVVIRNIMQFYNYREMQQRRDSLLVQLGIEGALRNICIAYEWSLKGWLSNPRLQLNEAIIAYFHRDKNVGWWSDYNTNYLSLSSTTKTIQYALGIDSGGDLTREFWKSLAVLHSTRNTLSHNGSGDFAAKNSMEPEDVLARLVYAFIKSGGCP